MKVIVMEAQEFANLRLASFEYFHTLDNFKEWLKGKHFKLKGFASEPKLPVEENLLKHALVG